MEAQPLTWSSDSNFRLWRYGVGHSQLSIRSFGGETGEMIEILFEGVERVDLNRQYHGLQVSIGYASHGVPQHLEVLISGSSGTGSVTCSRATIRRLRESDSSEIELLVSVHV